MILETAGESAAALVVMLAILGNTVATSRRETKNRKTR